MSAKFIVRFDDFCPTMNWEVWEQIESILARHDIKPIIAVVPDNRDPKLEAGPTREDFWERVRAWQTKGWAIAIHGHQHLYSTSQSGLMRINKYSEFSGYSYEEQRSKLEKGLVIFVENNVRVDAWIAPAHSFDENTVQALLSLNINVISDGFYWRPVKRLGVLWIPQQLWRFRKMRFGLWTVCLHHNDLSDELLNKFAIDVERYASNIISMEQAIRDFPAKDIDIFDTIMHHYWHFLLNFKTTFWPIAKHIQKFLKEK